MATIGELLNIGVMELRNSGITDARRQAALLLADLLTCNQTYLLAHDRDTISAELAARFRAAIARRSQGEPLQYITGQQEFYGREFSVTPAVLIPRPETEAIIETALKICKGLALAAPKIVDIGTGSGCIAVTLAAELPGAQVTALDISLAALAVARANARRYQLAARIDWLASDLCQGLASPMPAGREFDLCCANPPYVAYEERDELEREVREHEPARALFADENGLAIIGRLFVECRSIVRIGGFLICEIGFGQEQAALTMLDCQRWRAHETVKDLQGIARTLVIERIG